MGMKPLQHANEKKLRDQSLQQYAFRFRQFGLYLDIVPTAAIQKRCWLLPMITRIYRTDCVRLIPWKNAAADPAAPSDDSINGDSVGLQVEL